MYKPGELSSRIGILICMACIAGIVSGPIAYGTSFLEGRNKLHGWQYLFILEGVPTIVLSIVSYFSLFDTVDQVSWLTSEQKALQHKRMMDQEQGDGSSSKIGWGTIYKAIADWKTWLFAVVYMTNAVNFYSFAIFSPMLIDGNTWDNCSSRIEDWHCDVVRVWISGAHFPVVDSSSKCIGCSGDVIKRTGNRSLTQLQSQDFSLWISNHGTGIHDVVGIAWSMG